MDIPSNDVYVVTKSRFTDFKYNGVFYRHVDKRAEVSAEWVDRARVTTLEQIIADSIHNFEKIAGLEEVVRCILRAPRPTADKLLLALERYGNGFLYQKCGYVLEQMQEYVGLPEAFYRECREHCASTVRYMAKEAEGLVYSRVWGIYAPELRNDATDGHLNRPEPVRESIVMGRMEAAGSSEGESRVEEAGKQCRNGRSCVLLGRQGDISHTYIC